MVASHPVQNAGYDVIDYLENVLDREFRIESELPVLPEPPCEGCVIR